MNILTAQQQEVVLQHVGLVKMHVFQQMRRLAHVVGERERDDLLQEGLVGLMTAVSRYDPRVHGAFSTYALSHIHGAICQHLLRQTDGLAVSQRAVRQLAGQRRRRKWWGECQALPLPLFYDLESKLQVIGHQACAEYRRRKSAGECQEVDEPVDELRWPDAPADAGSQAEHLDRRNAQRVREDYEQAVGWTAERLKSIRPCRPDRAALIDAIVQERLLVPDPHYRTSKRSLARRFACSLGRLVLCEKRFHQLIREYLVSKYAQRASCMEVIGRPTGLTSAADAEPARKEVTHADGRAPTAWLAIDPGQGAPKACSSPAIAR